MKSIMNRKGQAIEVAGGTLISLFVLIVTALAIFLGISTLNPGSFFTAGSLARNASIALQDNTTQVALNFSNQLPVVGTVIGVLVILGAIGLLIFFVRRFSGQGTGGGL